MEAFAWRAKVPLKQRFSQEFLLLHMRVLKNIHVGQDIKGELYVVDAKKINLNISLFGVLSLLMFFPLGWFLPRNYVDEAEGTTTSLFPSEKKLQEWWSSVGDGGMEQVGKAQFCISGSLRIWRALFKKNTRGPHEHNARAPLENYKRACINAGF